MLFERLVVSIIVSKFKIYALHQPDYYIQSLLILITVHLMVVSTTFYKFLLHMFEYGDLGNINYLFIMDYTSINIKSPSGVAFNVFPFAVHLLCII